MIFDVPILQVSAAALVGVVCMLILTGRLVTRKAQEDLLKDKDKQIEAANKETAFWRKAWETEQRARKIESGHVGQLLEVAHTTTQVLSALPPPAEDPDATVAT